MRIAPSTASSVPVLMWLLLLCAASPAPGDQPVFIFRDVGDEAGVFPHVATTRGHGVAWGDVDGDGYPDLFLATFHNQGSKPSMLLRNSKGRFHLDDQQHLRTSGLGSGALFVDLNNSGRLDLFVSNCAHGKEGVTAAPSSLFRNEGGGRFTDISLESGACLPQYAGRGLAAADLDGDGLLDLITCERYYGNVNHGPAFLRNLGNHRFKNISKQAGFPEKLSGLGVAVADLNGDGFPDVVFTEGGGQHRVLLNDGKGNFRDAPGLREVLRWQPPTAEDTPAGVCIGDINGDGLPDIVIGQHYKAPWRDPLPVRLYLHRGNKDGNPTYEDVTEAAGITALAMKAPHVEIQDFDNDGLPDLYLSVVKFKDGVPHPVIYRNTGNNKDGIPQLKEAAWAVNDFPNAEDLAVRRTGDFFAKLLKDKKIIYMAAGPTGDYDRDGRLDIFLANWWNEDRSLLLRNETPGGNWLDVSFDLAGPVNRMGIGAKIALFPAGKNDPAARLGLREMAIGYGYCSGQEAIAHFGLGKVERVDVEVRLPFRSEVLRRTDVKVNQRLVIKATVGQE